MSYLDLIKQFSEKQISILEAVANGAKGVFYDEYVQTFYTKPLTDPGYWVKILSVTQCGSEGHFNIDNGQAEVKIEIDSDEVVLVGDHNAYKEARRYLYGINSYLMDAGKFIDKNDNVQVEEIKKFLNFHKEVKAMIEKYRGGQFSSIIRRIAAEGGDVDLFMKVSSAFKYELNLLY